MLDIINIVAVLTIVTVVSFLYIKVTNVSKNTEAINKRIGNLNQSLDDSLKKVGTRIEQDISSVQKNIKDNVAKLESNDAQIQSSSQQALQQALSATDAKQQELQKALAATQAQLAKIDMTKGGRVTGDIDVSGTTKTSTIKLGDKWSMSGVGDAFGNDDWLRFFDKDGKDYYGGLAAGKLWSKGGIQVGGDVVMEGTNKWILHTPDDGRKILYIAPSDEKGGWKWDKQVSFDQDGNMTVNGNVSLQDKQLRLRGLGDPNHYVGWSGAVDGPRIQGFAGGQLGTNHTGDKTALQWNQGGVNIPEKLCIGPTDNNWCFIPDANKLFLNIVRNNAQDGPDQAFFKLSHDGNLFINRNINRGWVAEGMRR